MMHGFRELSELPLEKVTDHYSRRAFVGAQAMMIWASMKAGAYASLHSHSNEQMFWVLSGRMEFQLAGEARTCRAGDLVLVPGGILHEAWYPEDTEFVTVLAPPRQDQLPGAPAPDHLLDHDQARAGRGSPGSADP